jgi:Protein of unknown function (DUF4054)
MAITTVMPPTVQEFRDAFPEFQSASDAQIQMALDTAMTWIDTWWFWPDAKLAVMYAAAHYLWLHDKASGGLITGGGGTGGGTPPVVDSEAGLIWVKSVRFRDRQVTYDRVSGSADASGGQSEHVTSSSEDFWQSSPYGQLYLSFRRRNVPHIAVI